jgi:Uma2 family endonuclease
MALSKRAMISVEEYLQLDKDIYEARCEYIDGQLRMLAGGSPNHAKISINISTVLNNALVESSCSVYSSDVRVRLSESRYVYPDVTISCDEQEQGDGNMLLYPRIAVEVLAPNTEVYDRGEKFTYYRECSMIQEYMLINTQHPFIEIVRREANNLWTYHAFESGDEVELASLDVRFPILEVYRKAKLPDTPVERDA